MDLVESNPHHKKTLHSKRSFGKHPHKIDSPAYDASEEDNDPLTDDGSSSLSNNVHSRPSVGSNQPRPSGSSLVPPSAAVAKSRPKHQLASQAFISDDDGTDSPTYDGDVESSTTAGPDRDSSKASSASGASHVHSSSTSTLTSPASVHHSLPDTSAPMSVVTVLAPSTPSSSSSDVEPITVTVTAPATSLAASESVPKAAAADAFNPAALTTEDIQTFVQKAIAGELHRKYKINPPPTDRAIRIYADGVYDLFHFGHALQLRQAKLSFPNVYLLVGVNSDQQVREHKFSCVMSHAERCEAVSHCRWVDEVVPEAPWVIDADFIAKYAIDYVAHDEDPYVSAGHEDVYSFVKHQGKFIPTRRTPGVSTSSLLERIVKGYRKRDFDKKLANMGHAELMAEGSDYEEKSSGR